VRKKGINQIKKKKLINNKAMIPKADKGNSIVITYQDVYNIKAMNFTSNNNFTATKNDITKKNSETSETPLIKASRSYTRTIDGSK